MNLPRRLPARLLLLALAMPCLADGESSAPEHVAGRTQLTHARLTASSPPDAVVGNAAFLPTASAGPARHAFSGELAIPEFRLSSLPDPIHDGLLLGKDTQRFPRVKLAFVSHDGELLPMQRDIVLTREGSSFWDLIVDPGRVWSEPGDDGLSRASFPFVLMNRTEGESHNGVATFLYDDTTVSSLLLQVVQQTAPFYVRNGFTAWGATTVTYAQHAYPERQAIIDDRAGEIAARIPLAGWDAFAARYPGVSLAGLDNPAAAPDTLFSGLYAGDTIYTTGCRTEAGDFPYCESMRFGVWSATKSLVPGVALLRLAQKYGAGAYAERIAEHLQVTANPAAWKDVSFLDAANMATGIGSGSSVSEPNRISDGYLEDGGIYDRWYQAGTAEQKLAITFAERAYPWGPGRVARYRDQDPLVLAAAMDSFLKRREGPQASLWKMLVDEVYRPLGIRHLPQARTIAAADGSTLPIASYGLYPTAADAARVARLLQNRGRQGDAQILWAPGIERYLRFTETTGLPTGDMASAGEVRYAHLFWNVPLRRGDCRVNIPQMQGWGGNVVALLPNGMTALRFANDMQSGPEPPDLAAIVRIADAAQAFCPP